MKTFWIILAVLVIIFSGAWFFLLRGRDKPDGDNKQVDTAIPAAYDESIALAEFEKYTFKFGSNLEVSYPKNWVLSEGGNNSDDLQIVTIESPKDDNGHYFCLNLDEYGAANKSDLNNKGVNVLRASQFMADGIGKNLWLVIYNNSGTGPLRSVLVDEQASIQTGNAVFDEQIVNPAGRRVQVSGRFDCREDNQPQLSIEQYENSHWHQVSLKALATLKY